ncbi:MAG: rRNA pseudouridine synthase [Bacteroidales bacterium]|nr:rRNA pseudouridine synthase [Bacteroidales bacterium]
MDQYSKEGRKLRPRKSAAGSAATSERVEYHPAERKNYGEHKSYGENRGGHGGYSRNSYGTNSGPHHSFGEHKRSATSNGEHKSYGAASGEHRNFGGPRKSFGGPRGTANGKPSGNGRNFSKRPFKDKDYSFNRKSDEGINRMIGRRPVVNGSEEPVEKFPQMIKDEIRLNKFIANSGVCSRREADTLIQAGVVTVNGKVVTELGTKVNIYEDDIRFNGERLKGEEKVYIIMNKPKGFVTTASDPHAEKTVLDLVKECSARVYPVGRLDKNTTGVLMLTNDGEIAERLTHPSYDKKKIYQVALDRELSGEDFEKILNGILLSDGEVKADELEYIDESDHRKLGIEIHSGKNRIVRRIFESLGYTVKALDRVYFAGLTKKGLKKGEWRYLTESEAGILKMGSYI